VRGSSEGYIQHTPAPYASAHTPCLGRGRVEGEGVDGSYNMQQELYIRAD
jgi:hypothetical protein